jgi:multidrug efflux pump subunit AcrB
MAMVEGAVLAVVVVFLFLRDWRATIISALAIPLSAIPTFWFMDLMGFSLNQISLLALSLVAGVLVDDAIVEIENIVRHMRMGKSAYQAAIDAADEIGLAVLATTSAIVAVFLPVGIMPGVSGQFFKNFGLTVVVSVLMSLAVARLITPMIAAYFLKSHGEQDHAQGAWVRKYVDMLRWTLVGPRVAEIRAQVTPVKGRTRYYLTYWGIVLGIAVAVIAAINLLPKLVPGDFLNPVLLALTSLPIGLLTALWGTRKLTDSLDRDGPDDARLPPRFGQWAHYMSQRVRARLHDHRVWTMGAGYGALLLTVLAFITLQFTFQPEMDVNYSQIRIEMTPGTTLAQTADVAREVQTMLDREQGDTVEAAYASISPASAQIFLTLKKNRAMSSVDFEKKWSPRLARIPDARVSFAAQNGGFSGRALSITLASDDPVKLARTANQLVAEMQRLPELVAPRVSGDLVRPEIVIRPRMDLAASLGVTTAALSQTIRLATLGDIDQNSAKFSLSDRQIPIRVSLSEESRRDLATIENLPVPTTSGASVPLKSVADISFGSGPTTIQRTNQSRRLTIGADLAINPATGKAFVSGEAMTKINALPTLQHLPMGVTRMTVGQSKIEQEMVTNFLVAIVSGVFLVFAVLVLLYHRIMPPFVNMGSLLLAPLGAALALHLFGMPLSMPVFIGVLMLLGIVAKNSILMVDFALEEMNKGIDRFEAIMDAGRKRAQPIVMTTVAMVAGMVPTALALSGDGAWRQPMGVTVIGGLVVSTVLTLLIVPAAFSLAVGFETRMGPWLRHKLLTYKPGDEGEETGTLPYPAE